MLSASTQALFRDILELPDAFSSLPRVQKRVVKWGPRSEPVALPHSAVIVSEQFLLEMAQPKLFQANPGSDDGADWTIISSRPLPESVVECGFGSRTATVAPVQLEKGSDSTTCWIESLEDLPARTRMRMPVTMVESASKSHPTESTWINAAIES